MYHPDQRTKQHYHSRDNGSEAASSLCRSAGKIHDDSVRSTRKSSVGRLTLAWLEGARPKMAHHIGEKTPLMILEPR